MRIVIILLLVFGFYLPAGRGGQAQTSALPSIDEIRAEVTRLLEAGEAEEADIHVGSFFRRTSRDLRGNNTALGEIARQLAAVLFENRRFAQAVYYQRRAAIYAGTEPGRDSAVEAERREVLGRYTAALVADAEPRLRNRIAAAEKDKDTSDEDLADLLTDFARLILRVGRNAEAAPLLERAATLADPQQTDSSEKTTDLLRDLFSAYVDTGRFTEAMRIAARVQPAVEQREGLRSLEATNSATFLANSFDDRNQGILADVVQKSRIERLREVLGRDDPAIVEDLRRLAERQLGQRRHAAAEETLRTLIPLMESSGDRDGLAARLFDLADSYRGQGRERDAERLASLGSGLMRDDLGRLPERARTELDVQADAATQLIARQEYIAAGPALQKWLNLALLENALDDERVRERLSGLQQACNGSAGDLKSKEARPLVDFCLTALDWSESRFPDDPAILGAMRSHTAIFLAVLGDNEAARQKFLSAWEALRDLSFVSGSDPSFLDPHLTANLIVQQIGSIGFHADAEAVARQWAGRGDPRALGPLAEAQAAQGNVDGAVGTLRLRLEDMHRRRDPTDCCVSQVADQLAFLLSRHDRDSEADRYLRDLLALQRRDLSPDDPALAATLTTLSKVAGYMQRRDDAERFAEEAAAIRRREAERKREAIASRPIASLQDARDLADSLEARDPDRALAVLAPFLTQAEERAGPDSDEAVDVLAAMVRTARRARPDAALSLSRDMLARLDRQAAREPADITFTQARRARRYAGHVELLASLLRAGRPDRMALMEEAFIAAQQVRETSAADAIAKVAQRFATGGDALGAVIRRRQDAAAAIRRIDESFRASAEAGAAARIAERLTELDRQRGIVAEADRRLGADFPRYAALNTPAGADLAEIQRLLRPGEALLFYLVLDENTQLFVVRPTDAALLTLPVSRYALAGEVARLRRYLDPAVNLSFAPYPAADAYRLHQSILAAAEPYLAKVRHLLVVTDGALDSFPLGALVTAEPEGNEHRRHAWLARRYAVSVLPSVGSLRALRVFAAASRAPQPFLGAGDPLLEGKGSSRGALAAVVFRAGSVDVAEIRKLARLEESATELAAMAATIGGSGAEVLLGAAATEAAIKKQDLSRFRVLAFATHGLLSGELRGNAEAALVMTPPQTPSPEDDGLLTASEIAALQLDADWVILSACNTAGPDGTPDGGGLSGLARAFLYAGSRSLLVSHWPVFSKAAVRLTTGAFSELAREGRIGRAEALRRSMTAMLDDPTLDRAFAHPAAWAPFIVVGEGGEGP